MEQQADEFECPDIRDRYRRQGGDGRAGRGATESRRRRVARAPRALVRRGGRRMAARSRRSGRCASSRRTAWSRTRRSRSSTLISCRNLLIYLDADLQDRVVRTFHYALATRRTFFFSARRRASAATAKLFAALDKKHHIFQRRDADASISELCRLSRSGAQPAFARGGARRFAGDDRIDRSARRALEKYSPAYVVIDRHENICAISGGEVGRYLGPSPGSASLNLFSNLRKTLRPVVRAALQTMFGDRTNPPSRTALRSRSRAEATP